jgi:hypothetical protein
MTNRITDPAEQWSDLLSSLPGRRREAVVAALRSSAQQGWPADHEAVRLLVAYAHGEIDAQDYAVGIVVSLGGHEGLVQQQAPQPVEPEWSPRFTEQRWTAPQQPSPPVAPQSMMTREEAVAAYVSGRIPVEEFLRITRGLSA